MLANLYKDIDDLEQKTLGDARNFNLQIFVSTKYGWVAARLFYAQSFTPFWLHESSDKSEVGIIISLPKRKQLLKIKDVLMTTLSSGFVEKPDGRGTMLLKNHKRDFTTLKADLKKIIEAFSKDGTFEYRFSYFEMFALR